MHQEAPAVGIGVTLFAIMLMSGLLGLVITMIAKKKWTGLCFVLAIFALVALFVVGDVTVQTAPETIPVDIRIGDGVAVAQTNPTLEALWDKLTEAQIKLDDEPGYKPELIDKEGKRAIANTVGLGDEDSVPPAWVLSPLKSVGSVYRARISSDPFVTEAECRRQLEQELLPQAVSNRLEILLPSKVRRKVEVNDPAQYGINTDFILREICVDEFTATVDTSVGPMKKVHVLMEFGQWEDNALVSKWMQHESEMRLARFGKIAGLSLMGLAAVYALLRFDTWSRGYYSKQLLVGGVLAIIAVGVFLLRT